MTTIYTRVGAYLALAIFVLAIYAPTPVKAQSRSSYSRGDYGSAYRSKINKLDDDIVKEIPIPVLFGVSLSQLWPNFGDPRDGGARKHEGFDIMASKGAPLVSPTEAVVIRTGTGDSSGKTVTTANPGGETYIYMHLDEILVRAGDVLKVGDIIGYVGDTGNAKGGAAHLHFEIRKSRKALDPYKRIKEEFSLEDKIEHLTTAIDEVKDEDELIDFVLANYQTELKKAKLAGIELPKEIDEQVVVANTVGATAYGDLDLNSTGPLVTKLQDFLIKESVGPAGKALADNGSTGFFGPMTQKALAEYQKANGITPATGYYGPKTRAFIQAQ